MTFDRYAALAVGVSVCDERHEHQKDARGDKTVPIFHLSFSCPSQCELKLKRLEDVLTCRCDSRSVRPDFAGSRLHESPLLLAFPDSFAQVQWLNQERSHRLQLRGQWRIFTVFPLSTSWL